MHPRVEREEDTSEQAEQSEEGVRRESPRVYRLLPLPLIATDLPV